MPSSTTSEAAYALEVMSARVRSSDGAVAASIDLVQIGGGTQTVNVDGVLEDRTHPIRSVWHVRLLSPDRMIPDQLQEITDWDAAVALATRYAAKYDEAAQRVAEIAAELRSVNA